MPQPLVPQGLDASGGAPDSHPTISTPSATEHVSQRSHTGALPTLTPTIIDQRGHRSSSPPSSRPPRAMLSPYGSLCATPCVRVIANSSERSLAQDGVSDKLVPRDADHRPSCWQAMPAAPCPLALRTSAQIARIASRIGHRRLALHAHDRSLSASHRHSPTRCKGFARLRAVGRPVRERTLGWRETRHRRMPVGTSTWRRRFG